MQDSWRVQGCVYGRGALVTPCRGCARRLGRFGARSVTPRGRPVRGCRFGMGRSFRGPVPKRSVALGERGMQDSWRVHGCFYGRGALVTPCRGCTRRLGRFGARSVPPRGRPGRGCRFGMGRSFRGLIRKRPARSRRRSMSDSWRVPGCFYGRDALVAPCRGCARRLGRFGARSRAWRVRSSRGLGFEDACSSRGVRSRNGGADALDRFRTHATIAALPVGSRRCDGKIRA